MKPLYRLSNKSFNFFFRHHTHVSLYNFSFFKHKECRDRHYTVLSCKFRFLIYVNFAYIFLIITLIKKDIYNPSSSKKLAGGWCITSFVLLGMGVAKVLSSSVEYTAMIRIASLCSYFCSLGSILGVFHLVKYFAVKKWEVEK